ncbi:XRE family transcriptional regulator [Pseudonocardia alni]|uniref:helix-turn-helix domain-containing protein n=1 Tax=Pseudonocardia alni TaxID=33907 RepID=UPI0033FAB556
MSRRPRTGPPTRLTPTRPRTTMTDRPAPRPLRPIPAPGAPASSGPSLVTIAQTFDPARLTQARHLAGLTKKSLAEAVGVSAAAIGQYETGITTPSPSVLEPLAVALGVPPGFFATGRPHGRLATGTAHFRSLRRMRVYQRDKAIATVEQVWELAHELERYVALPPVGVPDLDADPVAAAKALRQRWDLGTGPVQHFIRRLEAFGVIVVTPPRDPDSDTVDAFSTCTLPRPVMVLTPNRTDDVYRHRFTAAHELGHLVMHRDLAGTDPVREREADQFAAEFLTPRDSILPSLPRRLDLRHLAELSRVWGVSVHSLLYRCRETGLLSDSAASRGYQRLNMAKDQPGFRPEPLSGFPSEQPIMLKQAFTLAATEADLTIDVLAERLRWTVERCEHLLGFAAPARDERPRLQLLTDTDLG